MSEKLTPLPLITSEKIPAYKNFAEDNPQGQALERGALVASVMDDRYGKGEAIDSKSESINGATSSNATYYRVERSRPSSPDQTDAFTFTIDRKVSESLQDKAVGGKVEVTMDAAGELLYSNAYAMEGHQMVQQELTPQDALNAAAEAYSMVHNANQAAAEAEQLRTAA